MRNAKPLLFIIFLTILASCTPVRGNDITAEELKKLMSATTRLFIVDTRSEYEYKQGRIPKSVNISEEKFNSLDTLLPQEKDIPLVFYCRGVG